MPLRLYRTAWIGSKTIGIEVEDEIRSPVSFARISSVVCSEFKISLFGLRGTSCKDKNSDSNNLTRLGAHGTAPFLRSVIEVYYQHG